MGTDTFHQTRLIQAPSNLGLVTSRDGAATASLGYGRSTRVTALLLFQRASPEQHYKFKAELLGTELRV